MVRHFYARVKTNDHGRLEVLKVINSDALACPQLNLELLKCFGQNSFSDSKNSNNNETVTFPVGWRWKHFAQVTVPPESNFTEERRPILQDENRIGILITDKLQLNHTLKMVT